MQESVSNPSTATEAPEPKKKRGRPPSSHEKTSIHKRQKTASSPPATLKRKRHYRSPSPIENSNRGNAHSEPLIPRTRLLNNLVNVFGNLVDVFESIGRNRNADQGDGVIALIYDPDVFGRAEQRFQSLGDYSADPIDLTSNNEAPIPQQVLDKVGEPGSVNSAIRANWEEVKMITQVLNDMISQLIRATANPTAEEENAPVASVKEAAEAVYQGSLKSINTDTRAALQTSDKAKAVSSIHSEGENVSSKQKIVRKDILTGEIDQLPALVRRLTDTSP